MIEYKRPDGKTVNGYLAEPGQQGAQIGRAHV